MTWTPEEHEQALAELGRLMDADPAADSPEGKRLAELAAEIEDFEQIYFPIRAPTPEEAALFRAEEEPKK